MTDLALSAAGDVAYDWDLPTDALTWSVSAAMVLGWEEEFLPRTGRAFASHVDPRDIPHREQRLAVHFKGRDRFECEYRLRQLDGGFIWVQDRGWVSRDKNGKNLRLQGVLRIVTARKLEEDRLRHLADFDVLTGRLNRHRLQEVIAAAINTGIDAGVDGAYLAIGIDNMAITNDAFGYAAGDLVLAEFARRLELCLTTEDALGRVGGDRFGVLIRNCPSDRIAARAESIIATVQQTPVATDMGPIYVTASVGSVAFPTEARTASDVLTRGETALAEAKRSGRDCFAPYRATEESRRRHRSGMLMAEQVQRALKEGRLLLAFQPVVFTRGRGIDYYECLLRMQDEDGNIVGAGDFVATVESLGFIRAIDRFVLERTVAELIASPEVSLGLNISAFTAGHDPWLRLLMSLLEAAPNIAPRLVVEITETAVLNDFDSLTRFVATLRGLGCRVALDDFGAGFTSLYHLQVLEMDTVKLDGAFVRIQARRPGGPMFLSHLLAVVHDFGMQTVAEWIEDAEEMAILEEAGIDAMQGYFLGKPALGRPWET